MTKKVSRTVLSVVSLYGLATCQACSFLGIEPPPASVTPGAPIQCTTNRAPPIIDTVFAATNVASVVYVANQAEKASTQDEKSNAGAAILLGIAVAGLWMSSAVYGYNKTSECEALLAERNDDTPFRPANYVVVPPGQPNGRSPATPPGHAPPLGHASPPPPATEPGSSVPEASAPALAAPNRSPDAEEH